MRVYLCVSWYQWHFLYPFTEFICVGGVQAEGNSKKLTTASAVLIGVTVGGVFLIAVVTWFRRSRSAVHHGVVTRKTRVGM